jgi:hypothetical protein
MWDPAITIAQIGQMNLLAISGGRYSVNAVGDLVLPVGRGYSVEIAYAFSDTYTVRRVYTQSKPRAGRWVKGEVSEVFCEEIGEVAYRASCYMDDWAGEVSYVYKKDSKEAKA